MSATVSKGEKRWAAGWAVFVVALACLPYLVAWQLAPDGVQYTGLLVNPLDGESYYAKMQQGARGDWLFHLVLTPEPHEGAFIYVFYLALGQLAGAIGLPVPLVYHLARAAAGLFLLLVAYRFIARFFARVPARRATFLLLAFSAGFGWLLAPLGMVPADLWVAEGFTFLSILTNPHFPLTIGLMLLLFMTILDARTYRARPGRVAGAAGLGLLLAVVQPFAVPIVLAVSAVYLAVATWAERRIPRYRAPVATAALAGAAPVMIYDLVVYRTNPAMAAWFAQNVTPSLPPWEYALGYGLIFLLALPGIVVAARRRRPADLFLLSWVGCVAVLLYIPFALQRRFITGLHVPLVLLATLGLERVLWPRIQGRQQPLALGLVVGLSALTNLVVPLASIAGVAQGRAPLVMSNDQAVACAWLKEHTTWTDTVLAPADSGQFIPAWAGNRVVYGHPFETIDADNKRAEVERFFAPAATPSHRRELLERYGVRYVLWPAKAVGEGPMESLGLVPAWSQGSLTLYRAGDGP